MINFLHISPTKHLANFCKHQTHHLLLAHLVESDEAYANWYANRKKMFPTDVFILDNSAFEMYKQGKPMYPSDKLVEMGQRVSADYIVMTDYPGMPGSKTIEAALQLAPRFREAGFGTFFVPQSVIGDYDDYIETFGWASRSEHVDYIGVSILGVPNAYGVEKDNKLQRFMSRWRMMDALRDRGILYTANLCDKKIHFLGMVDGPREIQLVRHHRIHTWDSSAAVWAGLNGITFDDSPTGLINGKFEKEVDFDFHTESVQLQANAIFNCDFIDDLCN